MSNLLYHLRRCALARDCANVSDRDLLEAFVVRRDAASFEALVRRHGPMVLGVCRRVLRNHHDAEDAFQATFLVLIRRASVVPAGAVGNWLYGVAYRTALDARRTAARRQPVEILEEELPQPATESLDPWRELRPLLDEELSRLPDKFRSAVVLCDLEGRTRAEAALHLGVPEGTVSGRLTTARRLLAARLTRRGITLSAAGLAAVLAQGSTRAAVPVALRKATLLLGGTSPGAAATVPSATVATLADRITGDLFVIAWKRWAVALIGVPLLGLATTGLLPRSADPSLVVDQDSARELLEATPLPRRPGEIRDRDRLQGTWVAIAGDLHGRPLPDLDFAQTRFVFTGDRVTFQSRTGTWRGTYRLDLERSPHGFDILFDENAYLDGIYELAGDRLKMSWNKGGPRATGFGFPHTRLNTFTFVFEKR
jgi:RNA polymerase sigma factor (sigma-70 family)